MFFPAKRADNSEGMAQIKVEASGDKVLELKKEAFGGVGNKPKARSFCLFML